MHDSYSKRNDLHPQVVLADLGERVQGNEQLGRDKAMVKKKRTDIERTERREVKKDLIGEERERERRSAWIRKGRGTSRKRLSGSAA